MAGIVGISNGNNELLISKMLNKIYHRGGHNKAIKSQGEVSLGTISGNNSQGQCLDLLKKDIAKDAFRINREAYAMVRNSSLVLSRDTYGVAPLYFGKDSNGHLCFASEVKALLVDTNDVQVLEPRSSIRNGKIIKQYQWVSKCPEIEVWPSLSSLLNFKVKKSVTNSLPKTETGAWLSGGLDSSIIVAILRKFVPNLRTFVVGLPGSDDLSKAKLVANYLRTNHTEVIITPEQLFQVLPQTIYHLESFDALLVRSSLLNDIAAKAASDYVTTVFSGEGTDELFAGYEYLKALDQEAIEKELLRLCRTLHKTAFQRVDRCASAFGLTPILPFLDKDVVTLARDIPLTNKIEDQTEKWILREAFKDQLSKAITSRKKTKFWEGVGLKDILKKKAEDLVTDYAFARERVASRQLILRSKEEVLYFRIFKEHFGNANNFVWVGRIKQTPNDQGGSKCL